MSPLLLLLFPLFLALSLGQSTVPQQPSSIIQYSTDELKSNAPRYVNTLPRYVDGLGDTSLVDNICVSYFALTDCYDLLLLFTSYVYVDGTNTVSTYLVAARTPGVLEYTSPDASFNHTVFTTDDNTYYVYQSSGDSSYVFGVTLKYGRYSPQFQCTVSQYGYGTTNYLFLPMKLPPQCITCMTCSDNSQGCRTNNNSTRSCPNNNCPTNNCPTNNCPINNCPNNNYPTNNCPNNNYPSYNSPNYYYPPDNCPTINCPNSNCPNNNCPTCNQPPCGC